MIHANPPSDIFISISHARDGVVNKLPRLLFVTTLTITLMVVPAVAQTPSFHGLGEMPGVWPAAGTYASGISGDNRTVVRDGARAKKVAGSPASKNLVPAGYCPAIRLY